MTRSTRLPSHSLLGALAASLSILGGACSGPAKPATTLPAEVGGGSPKAGTAQFPVDLDQLAERVVAESAAVREGDFVQILGTPEDSPLMESIAIAVRKRGAFPLLTITSDRLEARMYKDVPEKYDTQAPALELALAEVITVLIELSPESDEIYTGVSPDRIARVFEARQGLHARHRERNVRQIYLGYELYPSKSRAERYGVSYDAIAKNYWGGLSTDPQVVRGRIAWMQERLKAAKKIEVTNPNGTHLTMSLAGRKLMTNDGVLTPEELAHGGDELLVWLPSGEVFAAPDESSVSGTLVVDRLMFQDGEVEDLRLDFTAGKVSGMSAKKGFDGLKKFYDAAGAGKDRFAVLDIGLNPNVEHIAGSMLFSPVASGMITLGIGRNSWAGGDNDTSFGLPLYLPGSSLLLDGEAVISAGKLQLPAGVK